MFGLYVRAIGFAPVYDDNMITPWNSLQRCAEDFSPTTFSALTAAHTRFITVPWRKPGDLLMSLATGGAPGWLHLGAILLHVAVVVLAYVFGRHLFG